MTTCCIQYIVRQSYSILYNVANNNWITMGIVGRILLPFALDRVYPGVARTNQPGSENQNDQANSYPRWINSPSLLHWRFAFTFCVDRDWQLVGRWRNAVVANCGFTSSQFLEASRWHSWEHRMSILFIAVYGVLAIALIVQLIRGKQA